MDDRLEVADVVARERHVPHKHFKQDDAHAPQVRARVVLLLRQHLGRHVEWRAAERGREARRLQDACKAKIRDLGGHMAAGGRQEDVARLEVALQAAAGEFDTRLKTQPKNARRKRAGDALSGRAHAGSARARCCACASL